MAWTMLPKPGTARGPCEVACAHEDCHATRDAAAASCRFCNTAIGYGVPIYKDPEAADRDVHASCLEDSLQKPFPRTLSTPEALTAMGFPAETPDVSYASPPCQLHAGEPPQRDREVAPDRPFVLRPDQLGEIAGVILGGLFDAIRDIARRQAGHYACSTCGCRDIEWSAWIAANGAAVTGDDYNDDVWCPECEEHYEECCFILPDGTCQNHEEPMRDPKLFFSQLVNEPPPAKETGCPGGARPYVPPTVTP